MIRRQSSSFAAKMGNGELAPVVARTMEEQNDSYRINYQSGSTITLFDPKFLPAEVSNNKALKSRIKRNESILKSVQNKKEDDKERESSIRTLRNYQLHVWAPEFVEMAKDSSESEYLRLVMIEALGWFNYSYQRDMIADQLEQLMKNEKLTPRMKDEVVKSIKRLRWK